MRRGLIAIAITTITICFISVAFTQEYDIYENEKRVLGVVIGVGISENEIILGEPVGENTYVETIISYFVNEHTEFRNDIFSLNSLMIGDIVEIIYREWLDGRKVAEVVSLIEFE